MLLNIKNWKYNSVIKTHNLHNAKWWNWWCSLNFFCLNFVLFSVNIKMTGFKKNWQASYLTNGLIACLHSNGIEGSANYFRISSIERILKKIIIHLPPEFLPVSEPLTRWCPSTLGTALLCSFRACSSLKAYIQTWVWGLCWLGSSSQRLLVVGFVVVESLSRVLLHHKEI